MRRIVLGCCLFVAVLWLSFSTVFFLFPLTPIQEDVRDFLNTGEGELPFSEDANSHMVDVFNVLRVFRVVGFLSLLVVLYFSYLFSSYLLRQTGYFLVGVPVVLAILPWNTLFKYFHVIFFPMGNWQFSASSLLIQTYPESFFVLFSSCWAALLIVTGFLCILQPKKLF